MKGQLMLLGMLRWVALLLLFALAAMTIYAVLTYKQGTARDVEFTLISPPMEAGDELELLWEGYLYRSCDIVIQRRFVDSNGAVINLVSSFFGAIPDGDLGETMFDVKVHVPVQVAPGPVIYQVTEVPRCTLLQRLFPVGIEYPPVEFVLTRPENTP